MTKTKYQIGVPRKTHRMINGKRRWVEVTKLPSGKEKVTIVESKVRRGPQVRPYLRKTDDLYIEGRRWFDSKWGNTYHTATIYINGEYVGSSDMTYGYDEQYLQTAFKMLKNKGYLPMRYDYTDFIMDIRNNRKHRSYEAVDVKRQRDL